jgi:hypothetical protein
MANECIPFSEPGDRVSHQASGAVTGKRFGVIPTTPITGGITGFNLPLIAQATSAGVAIEGVIVKDAASGAEVDVISSQSSLIIPVTAGANITVGDPLKTDAQGRAIPQAGTGVIVAWAKDSALSGADVPIRFA